MATTAVVNPRRNRKGQFVKGGRRRSNPSRRHKRRRRNYGAAAEVNPRRRRRHYGTTTRRRRRHNPISPYAYRGYRYSNPGEFSTDEITEVVPAATAGIWAGRFALKQAGAFEASKDGTLEPGLKHAAAIWLAAVFGSKLVGDLFGDEAKGRMARIACFGFGGDLFLRTKFMRDSDFVQKNLSLQGLGQDIDDTDPNSMMGAPTMIDAWGNQYVSTPAGWQMAGADDGVQLVQDADGNVYALSGGGDARLAGFETQSPIAGFSTRSPISGPFGAGGSSFGYSRVA